MPIGDVDMSLQHDTVPGERSGLVGAQDVHGPEVLDGLSFLRSPFSATGKRAFRQAHGHRHRKHFRRESDGDRQQPPRFDPIMLGEPHDQEHDQNHHHHEPHHEAHKRLNTLVEGCGELNLVMFEEMRAQTVRPPASTPARAAEPLITGGARFRHLSTERGFSRR